MYCFVPPKANIILACIKIYLTLKQKKDRTSFVDGNNCPTCAFVPRAFVVNVPV